MQADAIRTKWETIAGYRTRLRLLLPATHRWRDSGDAPPLLLLHGLGCTYEAWEPTLRILARTGIDRLVVAPDLPGSGKSAAGRHVLSIDELADWCVLLLDLLGLPHVHLGGNSLGCQVCLALARRHPDRVGRIVLVGPTEGADVVPLARLALGLLADALHEPGIYTLALGRWYWQTGTRRYLATVERMVEDDPVYLAGEVRAPCLILRGENDAIVPPRALARLTAALPGARMAEIPGQAHALQYSAPAAFLSHALPFWGVPEEQIAYSDYSQRMRRKNAASPTPRATIAPSAPKYP